MKSRNLNYKRKSHDNQESYNHENNALYSSFDNFLDNSSDKYNPNIIKSKDVKEIEKKDFFGVSPTPFVGRYGYPDVNLGILASPVDNLNENAGINKDAYDNPKFWNSANLSISEIIKIRSLLVNSHFSSNVLAPRKKNRLVELSQEISMSSRPVDVEVSLKSIPSPVMRFDVYSAPLGSSGKLKDAKITGNTKIERKIDNAVDDNNVTASEMISELYDKGIDETRLSRMFSVGLLGIKKQRKLVPTRWSITAIDDLLGKKIHKKIMEFPESDYMLFQGSLFGNYYFIMAFADSWSYELFELFVSEASRGGKFNYSADNEGFNGRKSYAESTTGGYYTVRLAVLERLYKMRRQASVLAVRIVSDEYSTPLGVWVTREASRNAMKRTPLRFDSKELMMDYVKEIVIRKFGVDLSRAFENSILLRNLNKQKRLSEYI